MTEPKPKPQNFFGLIIFRKIKLLTSFWIWFFDFSVSVFLLTQMSWPVEAKGLTRDGLLD